MAPPAKKEKPPKNSDSRADIGDNYGRQLLIGLIAGIVTLATVFLAIKLEEWLKGSHY